jgi:hypothetical protein
MDVQLEVISALMAARLSGSALKPGILATAAGRRVPGSRAALARARWRAPRLSPRERREWSPTERAPKAAPGALGGAARLGVPTSVMIRDQAPLLIEITATGGNLRSDIDAQRPAPTLPDRAARARAPLARAQGRIRTSDSRSRPRSALRARLLVGVGSIRALSERRSVPPSRRSTDLAAPSPARRERRSLRESARNGLRGRRQKIDSKLLHERARHATIATGWRRGRWAR